MSYNHDKDDAIKAYLRESKLDFENNPFMEQKQSTHEEDKINSQSTYHKTSTNINNELKQVFEDTRETKHVFGKYLLVRNFLGFIILINIMLALCLYEYIAIDPSNFPWPAKLISISTTIVQVGVIFVWITSIKVWTDLKKKKLIIGQDKDFIDDFGKYEFYFYIFIFLMHPCYFFVDRQFFIEENYYKADTSFDSYKRPWVEYMILIQFIYGVYFLLKIFLENLKYGNNRADRIARFFGIEADAVFVLRACMKRYPLFFVIFLEFFGIIFFGVLVRIAETNYVQHIPSDLTADEYDAEFSSRILFFNYVNVFWNMIITMTTIGYGDFYTRSTLARFFIIITGFYGILVTSLLVVAFTNLLEMESSEDIAFNIIKSLEVQQRKDIAAINLTSNILRGGAVIVEKGGNKEARKKFFKKKLGQDLKNYVDVKQEYRSMNIDKTEFLTTKAFKLFSTLGKWDIKASMKLKKQADEQIQSESEEDNSFENIDENKQFYFFNEQCQNLIIQ